MGFFSKDLSQLVAKVLEKKRKVTDRIKELNQETNAIETEIKTHIKNLVDFELNSDEEGQKNTRKVIADLNNKIKMNKDLLEAYENELESPNLSKQEIQRIKEAARQERDQRKKKAEDTLKEKEKVSAKISQLQQQEKQLANEYESIINQRDDRDELKKIFAYIEPRHKNIKDSSIGYYLSAWISEESDTDSKYLDQYVNNIGFKEDPKIQPNVYSPKNIDEHKKNQRTATSSYR